MILLVLLVQIQVLVQIFKVVDLMQLTMLNVKIWSVEQLVFLLNFVLKLLHMLLIKQLNVNQYVMLMVTLTQLLEIALLVILVMQVHQLVFGIVQEVKI